MPLLIVSCVLVVWMLPVRAQLLPSGTTAHHRFAPQFEHLTIDEGLSQSSIFAILQDRSGYLWFCTQDGLNRFDGYRFTVFRNRPEDSLSLAVNWVNDLYESRSSGRLWAMTRSAVNLFLPHSEQFRVFPCILPQSGRTVTIAAAVEDNDGILWIATDNGLFAADAKQGTTSFVELQRDKKNETQVSALAYDSTGTLWIGTSAGLFRKRHGEQDIARYSEFDAAGVGTSSTSIRALRTASNGILWATSNDMVYGIDTKSGEVYKRFPLTAFLQNTQMPLAINCDRFGILWLTLSGGVLALNPVNGEIRLFAAPAILPGTTVFAWNEDADGRVWIGTNAGLSILTHRTKTGFPETFTHLANRFNDTKSIGNNIVRAILRDRVNTMWVGTDNGINSWNPLRYKFATFTTNAALADISNYSPATTTVANTSIRAFLWNDDATLWVGTDDGLNLYNAKTATWRHFGKKDGLINTDVRALTRAADGQILCGTNGGGLLRYNPKTSRFAQETYKPDDSTSLNSNRLRAFFTDKQGTLWVGLYAAQGIATTGVSGGIGLLRKGSTKWQHLTSDGTKRTPSHNEIRTFYSDDSLNIWIGTHGGGANYFDAGSRTFTHFKHDAKDSTSLSSNIVTCIMRSRAGVLWIATASGLNRFNEKETAQNGVAQNGHAGTFTRYTVRNGLPNDFIYGILEDANGNLWLSTNKGVSCFTPRTETFRNYDHKDGLPSNEFNAGAFYKLPSGEMLFGSIAGFVLFPPEQVQDSKYEPPVMITSVKVLNTARSFDVPLATIESITLPYNENFIAFEFAALEYIIPERNRYAYKLDGIDKDWIQTGSDRRYAAYSDLKAGEYVFRLRVSNADGVWSKQERRVRVVIIPPFWQTWWFRLLMLSAGAACLWVAYRGRVSYIQRRNKVLERLVHERTAELETANDELNAVNNEIVRQNHILEEQTAHIEIANTQLQEKNIELGILNEQLEDYAEEVERYNAKLEEQAKLIEQKNAELHGKNEELAIVNEQLEDYSQEMERYSAKLEHQAQEITDASKRIQEQNTALQSLNLRKNELIGVVAHDLKNPLSAILMSSSLMLRYYDKMTKDDHLQNTQRIKETGERMNKIIMDLLDVEAIESGKFNLTIEEVSIDALLAATLEDYRVAAERKDMSILLECAPNLPSAATDKNALRQVLDNLISNAVKYSPLHSRIWLRTRLCTDTYENSNLPESGILPEGAILIDVQDEGPGLSEDDQAKLFGRFAKLTPQPTGGEHSTGLGLSIVKQLAEAMGGGITCTSALGKGTTFTLRVPLHKHA